MGSDRQHMYDPLQQRSQNKENTSLKLFTHRWRLLTRTLESSQYGISQQPALWRDMRKTLVSAPHLMRSVNTADQRGPHGYPSRAGLTKVEKPGGG